MAEQSGSKLDSVIHSARYSFPLLLCNIFFFRYPPLHDNFLYFIHPTFLIVNPLPTDWYNHRMV